LLIQTIFSLIQSKYGNLFFLPKSCIPGYHNYFVSIDKLPKDKIDEECVMCYTSLKQAVEEHFGESPNSAFPASLERGQGHPEGSPMRDSGVDADDKEEPIFQKSKKVAMTPCNHYFHVSCFKQWIKVKHECPICRTQLKFYLE
jgi:hypothetical protein